jgi:SAM-dependent methyltransferase
MFYTLDRGDLVNGLLEDAVPFVYDISGIPAVEGVTSTSDPAGCKADLIISSNVFEHVSFPRDVLGEILRVTPRGGYGLPGSSSRITFPVG